MAKIGIIGGTGVYDPEILEESKSIEVDTPFGKLSDKITTGFFKGHELFILPRHGSKHTINPTNVNYRANIFALKKLGVTRIIAPLAVGSLREDYKPGELVFVNQFIDRTTKRQSSFYNEEKVCHISVADPVCKNLMRLLMEEATKAGYVFHEKGTIVVIEGPRFSTKAESELFRSWKADVIGMTMTPECVLAREAEICYAPIATVTDYDCWKEGHEVSVEEVVNTMKKSNEKVKNILKQAIPRIKEERSCSCKDALKNAFI